MYHPSLPRVLTYLRKYRVEKGKSVPCLFFTDVLDVDVGMHGADMSRRT